MRENEKNVGRADHNLPGARSAAEGETQEPEKVVDDDASRREENAVWGDEGGGGQNSLRKTSPTAETDPNTSPPSKT
jgi:hypothetical protein